MCGVGGGSGGVCVCVGDGAGCAVVAAGKECVVEETSGAIVAL